MDVLLDNDGKVRNSKNLEQVGHWFEVDNVKYYIPIYNGKEKTN
jgi:hypothetical protein